MKKILIIGLLIALLMLTGCTDSCYYEINTSDNSIVNCKYTTNFMGGYKAHDCEDKREYYNYKSKKRICPTAQNDDGDKQ